MSSSDNSQTSKSLCLLIPGAAAHWQHFIGDTSTGGAKISELRTQITHSSLFRAGMLKISQRGLKIYNLPMDTCR